LKLAGRYPGYCGNVFAQNGLRQPGLALYRSSVWSNGKMTFQLSFIFAMVQPFAFAATSAFSRLPDLGVAIISVLTHGVGMVNDKRKSRAVAHVRRRADT
jgi:hypothetical protein